LDAREKRKLKLVLGIVVVVALLLFSMNSIGQFLNPLKFVSEVTAQPEQYMHRNVQVVGVIVNNTWRQVGPNSYTFRLTDGNSTIDVEYTGDVPGTFKPGIGVTVIGTLVAPDKVMANKLLVKCPSKYEETLKDAQREGRI